MTPLLTYIHWRDASYNTEEMPHEELGLVDLHEVGWIIKEDDECITLGVEWYPETAVAATRLTLTIPKVNIVRRKDFKLEKILGKGKR
jgi:hypothetical protein